MSGNAYPGYRGPTGTRNPAEKPQASPKNAGYSPGDKPRKSIWERVFQPRRTQNPTPSYALTASNVIEALNMAPTSGLGVAKTLMGALGVPGIAPDFKDYRGMVQGPGDWDPKNFAGPGDVKATGGLSDFAFRFYNTLPR